MSAAAALRRLSAPAPAAVALLALALLGAAAPAGAAGPRRHRVAQRAPAVAPARPDTTPDPWHEARRLADAGQFDAALAVLHAALAAHGDDFGLRWLEAGITGESGAHGRAVQLYERLGHDHRDRAGELLADLAAQRIDSGQPAQGARDLRAWLRGHPDDEDARTLLARALAEADSLGPALALYDSLLVRQPNDVDLAVARARVLAWMDRHGAAVAAYRAVLARDSTNAEARLGLAMNLNWSGHHRAAARQLARLADEPGSDPEARKALAFARYWDDDPDGARVAVDAYLRSVPGDREAQELSRRLRREQRPELGLEAGRADDSDHLRVVGTAATLTLPLTSATTLVAGWRRDHLDDDDGRADAVQLSAGLREHVAPALTAHAELAHTDWPGAGTLLGGEAGVVVRPVDLTRFEADVARAPVLTRQAVALGISLLDWVAAVDLQPAERLTLHGTAHAGFYSDANHAVRLAAAARWQAVAHRRFDLTLALTDEELHADSDPGHGYYAPAEHDEWGPAATAEWRPDERRTFSLDAATGWSHDRESETTTFYTLVGRARFELGEAWALGLEAGRSDSNLENVAGYERTWGQLTLTKGF